MPKLTHHVRPAGTDGAVWRECAACGHLVALAPDTDQCRPCRRNGAVLALALAEHFDQTDRADIADAGCVIAGLLADITHHEIADGGTWDCYGPTAEELVRLHHVLDRVQDAVKQARTDLVAVERRVRRRLARTASAGGPGGRPCH